MADLVVKEVISVEDFISVIVEREDTGVRPKVKVSVGGIVDALNLALRHDSSFIGGVVANGIGGEFACGREGFCISRGGGATGETSRAWWSGRAGAGGGGHGAEVKGRTKGGAVGEWTRPLAKWGGVCRTRVSAHDGGVGFGRLGVSVWVVAQHVREVTWMQGEAFVLKGRC